MAAMTREEMVKLLRGGDAGIDEFNARRRFVSLPGNIPGKHGEIMEEINLSDANLSGLDLRRAHLLRAHFLRTDFRGSDLRGVSLGASILNGANLSHAKLQNAGLNSSTLAGTNFTNANLTKADLYHSAFVDVDFSGAILDGVNLHGSSLAQCVLKDARLDNAQVYGTAAWDLDVTGASQKDLVINLDEAAPITVDNIEMAQFIYLMLHNEKIRSVIDTVTSKLVFILGRFTPERKVVLDAIREKLREHDYCPVMFDFDKPDSRTTDETVNLLADIARFIIADITDAKSVQQELRGIVPSRPSLVIQPLIQQGESSWGMSDFFKAYDWVLPLARYADATELMEMLDEKVIQPAEAKARERHPGPTSLM